ncbi:MAG: DUF2182 domain-containing protein [Dehalococcoidia bacterium]|nr:DUF2182 domain-containing protein [Dehalococcoidia bacterium]
MYQLTPLKYRCLSHCRSPFGHVMHAVSRHGPLRDFRTGFEHGYFCAACCWGLMLLLLAFGVMNVPAMILLAAAVAAEKLWSWGERLSKGIGYAALAAAVLVIWLPGLAPGLSNEPMDMNAMAVDGMAEMDGEDATIDAQ